MFDKKILFAIIICLGLLLLYYFYDEITNIKKLIVPSSHRIMELEAKMIDYEKKLIDFSKNKQIKQKKLESPIMSVSYVSDKKNLSMKYSEISEQEGEKLSQKIKNTSKQNEIISDKKSPKKSPEKNNGHTFEQTDNNFDSPTSTSENSLNKISKDGLIYNNESDSIDIRVTDLIKPKNNELKNLYNVLDDNPFDNSEKKNLEKKKNTVDDLSSLSSENIFSQTDFKIKSPKSSEKNISKKISLTSPTDRSKKDSGTPFTSGTQKIKSESDKKKKKENLLPLGTNVTKC